MNIDNYNYLTNQIKYLGFGEGLNDHLANHLKAGQDTFSLLTTLPYHSIGKKEVSYELNFRKGKEDMYFLNFYHATLDGQTAKFYVNNGEKNITSKEAFNLMEGRAVYRELSNKEGEKYHAWQKIDTAKSEGENIRFKSFSDNYGYDLEAAIKKVTAQQLYLGLEKDVAIQSLQKGNLVELRNMDKSEKYFVAADPQFKTMEIYDANGTKLRLEDVNKERLPQGERQSTGMKM